jgi:hypothetical protein
MEPPAKRRAPSFKFEIPGDVIVKQRFLDKVAQVRQKMMTALLAVVTNGDIIEAALDLWLDTHS